MRVRPSLPLEKAWVAPDIREIKSHNEMAWVFIYLFVCVFEGAV